MKKNGALAHLARAFDWQSRGGEFESRMLHYKTKEAIYSLFFLFYKKYSLSALLSQQKSLPLRLTKKNTPNINP